MDTFFRAKPLTETNAASSLPIYRNPLLEKEKLRTCNVEQLSCPTVFARRHRTCARELRDLRRKQTAAAAIHGLTRDLEVYGFTKGQFSLLDLIVALLEITGPARVTLSTWTAARHEILSLAELAGTGLLLSMRWLVDFTFARRDPEAAHQIRQTFGLEAIRVAQSHAKFCLLENSEWRLVLRSSMNLNMNPRFEDFTIAHDPQLADFLQTIIHDIWTRQERTLAEATPAEIRRHFATDL